MRVKVFTDTSKTTVEGIYIATVEYANAHYPGRWDEDVPPEPEAAPPVWTWYIDTGSFMDRFGAFKIPILASADPIVKAIVTDMLARKWIDLQRADVAVAMDMILGAGFAIDKTAILETPVTDEENVALRKLYF